VSALSPYVYVPAETKRCKVPGLMPYGVYCVAVVAEDVLTNFNPVVRSQPAHASVDRVREVRNLAATCGTNWLTFTWEPPKGADPRSNNPLVAHFVYLAGSTNPVVLDRWATKFTATNLLVGSTNLIDWVRLQTNTPTAMPYILTVTNAPGMNGFYGVQLLDASWTTTAVPRRFPKWLVRLARLPKLGWGAHPPRPD
jgi:hypothetical protein